MRLVYTHSVMSRRSPIARSVSVLVALLLALGVQQTAARCFPTRIECAPCCQTPAASPQNATVRPLLPCCQSVAAGQPSDRTMAAPEVHHPVSPTVLVGVLSPYPPQPTARIRQHTTVSATRPTVPLYHRHCALLL